MQKSNVNGALRLSNNNMSDGILPLSDETLQILVWNIQKHNKLTTKRY